MRRLGILTRGGNVDGIGCNVKLVIGDRVRMRSCRGARLRGEVVVGGEASWGKHSMGRWWIGALAEEKGCDGAELEMLGWNVWVS